MNGDLTRAGDTEYAEMKVKTMCWCYFSANPQRDGSKQHHEGKVGLSKDAEVKRAHHQCTKTLILFVKSWAQIFSTAHWHALAKLHQTRTTRDHPHLCEFPNHHFNKFPCLRARSWSQDTNISIISDIMFWKDLRQLR